MKKILTTIALIGISFGMKAQDLTLGINNALLGNNGSGLFTQLIFWNGSNAYYGRNALGAGINNQYFRTNGIDRMIINYDGNIGIGTTQPTSKLFINQPLDNNNGGLSISDTGGRLIQIYGEGSAGRQVIRTSATLNPLAFDLNGNEKMRINSNGNVGIGTTNLGSWKLAVNGKIRAKEIKVETGWSDFVFYDDYKLPTLQEVENHIKEKGHLKDIPSEKEVEKNGIFLGEMDSKLLQKIEELTLYTIQQQKEIDNLEKENEEVKLLNKKLLELQSRLEKLESEK